MIVKQGILKKDGLVLNTLEVELKNTTLLLLEGYGAFFMCGALDVEIYKDREVLAGKAVKVKTLEELYNAPVFALTNYAVKLGLTPGMRVYEAFRKISEEK